MHNDSGNPIDLSSLDPLRDRASFDQHAARIVREAMDGREQSRILSRRESAGIVSTLTSWARPTLLAAGIVFAIALTTVMRTVESPSSNTTVSAADAMGLPRRLTNILHSTAQPSLTELDVALSAAAP